MKLLIATRNPHKLVEIRDVLRVPGLELLHPGDLPGLPDVVEDGDTFEANALKKATEMAAHAGLWTLADDSGLSVACLGGAPGVYSARYAGEPVDYARNNRKLLGELEGREDRSAEFVAVVALCSPRGRARWVRGACAGSITLAPRGANGFGYDPVFVPDGHDRTFAELPAAVKNRISHRARALQAAAEAWRCILSGERTDWPPGWRAGSTCNEEQGGSA